MMEAYHYSCQICSKENSKETTKYGLEQFLFWKTKKDIMEHFKRKHPEEYKEIIEAEKGGNK